jgi:glycosyltransferase involved in cell wall biosynthesis
MRNREVGPGLFSWLRGAGARTRFLWLAVLLAQASFTLLLHSQFRASTSSSTTTTTAEEFIVLSYTWTSDKVKSTLTSISSSTSNAVDQGDQVQRERKKGDNVRPALEQPTTITEQQAQRLRWTDWPLSRWDQIRSGNDDDLTTNSHDPNDHPAAATAAGTKRAQLPTNRSAAHPIRCPQCRSILSGAVMGKRILLVGHELHYAGAEIWLLHVAEILEQSGASVRFFFPSRTGSLAVTPLLEEHDQRGLSYIFGGGGGRQGDESTTTSSSSVVEFDDFDAILANTAASEKWYSFFQESSKYRSEEEMHQLLSQKVVFWIHELDPDPYIRTTSYLDIILHNASMIGFDSSAGRDRWSSYINANKSKNNGTIESSSLSSSSEQRQVVIHPAVSKERMRTLENLSHQQPYTVELNKNETTTNAHEDDVVILQVSTLSKSKGVFDLVKAFSLMIQSLPTGEGTKRAWFLVLVGGQVNSEHRSLLKLANTFNDFAKAQGYRSRINIQKPTMNVEEYFATADIFILNSWCENFGMVLIEAMFAGLPVVARNCGGAPEIVSHGQNGFLLSNTKNHVSELQSLLLQMTTGPRWRRKLKGFGRRSRQIARDKFTYWRLARDLSNLFTRLFFFPYNDNKRHDQPLWRCTSARVDKRKTLVERSHGDQTQIDTPVLPLDARYEMGCALVGSTLYQFGGYQAIDRVSKNMEYYNIDENRWTRTTPLPLLAAETHSALAVSSDNRYIYVVSGQRGPACNRPTKKSFAFDTHNQEWFEIPELPAARYAGCAAILNGRLHFVGGSGIDRFTPMRNHYSISLEEIHASRLENYKNASSSSREKAPGWIDEPEIPYGLGHVVCRVLSSDSTSQNTSKLYFFGGESGDYYARSPDTNDFSCVVGDEYASPIVFVYDGSKWERGPDMPYALSHVIGGFFSPASIGNHNNITDDNDNPPEGALFFGGSGAHVDDSPDQPVLSDSILWFSAKTQSFERIGSLFPIGLARKGACGYGRVITEDSDENSGKTSTERRLQLYLVGGQATESTNSPFPAHEIENFALQCESNAHLSILV